MSYYLVVEEYYEAHWYDVADGEHDSDEEANLIGIGQVIKCTARKITL